MQIRNGEIVDNVVINLYAKFDDDRLWNEKALVDGKSDNNNPKNNNNNKNNIRGLWGPVSGSKNHGLVTCTAMMPRQLEPYQRIRGAFWRDTLYSVIQKP